MERFGTPRNDTYWGTTICLWTLW